MKAATKSNDDKIIGDIISIHAAREGGDGCSNNCFYMGFISIHAAREGGDQCVLVSNMFLNNISIHAAREGGDCGNE